jgi:hypothetical protein
MVRELIDDICRDIGPRATGSAAEAAAAELLGRRLESWGLKATVERFRVASRAFQGLLATLTGGYLLALAAYFACPLVAVTFLGLVLVVLVAHGLLDLDLPALVLPKSGSTNVHGRVAPAVERRHTVLFAGHHDSAFRQPLLARSELFAWLERMVLGLVAAFLLLLGLAVWRTVVSPGAGRPGWEIVALAYCGLGGIFALAILGGMIRRDAVPGANDNLSAVATAWEVARRLTRTPPRYTEVRVVSFGSEEAAIKGSREFAQRHQQELRDAVLVNLESLGQSGRLFVLTGEVLAGTRHSERAVRLVEDAARDVGIPLERKRLVNGLTDASSFSRRGLPATTVIRLNAQGFLDHYHSPGDSPEHVVEDHLEEAVRLCLAVVERLDREPSA